jgi:hypothetical protein
MKKIIKIVEDLCVTVLYFMDHPRTSRVLKRDYTRKQVAMLKKKGALSGCSKYPYLI